MINKCPKCHSTALVKDGKTAKGTQRYICKFCGTRSAGDRSNIIFKNEEKIKCRKCGSTNIKKKGYNREGIQVYFCRDCHKKFMVQSTKELKQLTKEEKEVIIRYHIFMKIPLTEIAKHLNRSYTMVYNYAKKQENKINGNSKNKKL